MECLECPKNSKCPGGKVLDLDEGFWRLNETSDEIIECDKIDNCLGGGNLTLNSATECNKGHSSYLCQTCIEVDGESYEKAGTSCSKCPNPAVNIL